MVNSDGKNMNVVYGFFRILLKLMAQKPDYLLITRDLPAPTQRSEIDSEYKANRPPAPDDFKQQIPLVHETVQQLGIPNVGAPWYEADDVIATIAKRLASQDITTFIVSSDKDLKQLLSKSVFVFDPMKDAVYSEHDFQKDFWFEPKYMLDYLSLIGDTADNIKWIHGIGPKSASYLIKTYRSLENIYDHIEEISPSVQKKLIAGKASGIHSKRLVELMHVDILDTLSLEDFKIKPNIPMYRQILVNHLGFESIGKVLDGLKNVYATPTQESLF